jgi:hypothetical protein
MKLKLMIAFLATAMLWAAGNAFSQNLSVDSATGAPGSTVNLSIITDAGVSNLAGVQFTLNFGDSSPANAGKLAIDASKVTAGGLFANGLITAHQSDGADVNIAVVTTSAKNGAGVVAVVPIQIPNSAPDGTVYSLKIMNVQGSDLNGHDVLISGQGGTLTAQSQTAPSPTGTGGGKAGFTLSTGTGSAGGVAGVDLSSTNEISDLTSFTIQIQFDSSLVIHSSDVVFSSLVQGLSLVNDQTAGSVTLGVVGTAPIKQSGVLARLNFHIPGNAKPGATYALKVTNVDASDSNAQEIQTTGSDGQVVVANTTEELPKITDGLVSVSSVKVSNGGTATVEISINDKIKNVSGALFQLSFGDKTPASAPDLKYMNNSAAGGSLMNNALVSVNPTSDTALTVGVVSAAAANGPGSLVKLSFKAVGNVPNNTVYSLKISNLSLSVNGSDATSASNGGTITVTSHKKGDLNDDDKVTISDVTTALRAALGNLTLDLDQLAACDFNGDGKVTISEVTLILQAALGLRNLDG